MPSIADVIDSVKATLADIPVELGEEFQHEAGSPPRIVFVPRDDRFLPVRSSDFHHGHRSVATRSVGLEARIWGVLDEEAEPQPSYPDLRATELLVDRVILALRENIGASLELEGGAWQPHSDVTNLGRLYALRFRVALPVIPTEELAASTRTTWTRVVSQNEPAAMTVYGVDPTNDAEVLVTPQAPGEDLAPEDGVTPPLT